MFNGSILIDFNAKSQLSINYAIVAISTWLLHATDFLILTSVRHSVVLWVAANSRVADAAGHAVIFVAKLINSRYSAKYAWGESI